LPLGEVTNSIYLRQEGPEDELGVSGYFCFGPGLTQIDALPMDPSEGDNNVHVRALENIDQVALPVASQLGACAGRVTAFEYETPTFGAEADHQAELVPDGLGLVRGIRIALAIEAGASLCLYGLWHLWHILR